MADFFRRREKLAALLLYVLSISVLHSPVVFFGKTLHPSLFQPHGIVEGWPYGYEGRVPVNNFNIDLATPAYFEWPINKFVGDIYKRGELPLWNPYQGAGTPLLAQYSTRALFPYQILEDMSPVFLWDYFVLGRILIAGFFTFLFLRLLSLPFAASFLGGLLYMFSGSFTWFVNLEQYANNAMMLPVFIYTLERLFRRRGAGEAGEEGAGAKRRSGWLNWIGGREAVYCALSFALVILAGQPEVALYVLFLGGLYYIFRLLTDSGKALFWQRVLRFFAVSVLALMLSSPLILPFLELMRNSHHIHPPGGEMGKQSILWMNMPVSLFTPTSHEFPQEPRYIPTLPLAKDRTPGGEEFYFRFFPTNGVWDYLGGYGGISAIYLAAAGVFASLRLRKWKNPLVQSLFFFSGFALSIVLKNFGIPPFVWLGSLPLFDQVWSQRWAGPAWTFALAVAGACALQVIREYPVDLRLKGPSAGEKGGAGGVEGVGGASLLRGPASPFLLAFLAVGAVYLYLSPLKIFPLYVKFASEGDFFMNFGPGYVLGSILTAVFLLSIFGITASHTRTGGVGMGGARVGGSGGGGGWVLAVIALVSLELWWAIPRGYSYDWLFLKIIPLGAGFIAIALFYREMPRAGAVFALIFFIAFSVLDMLSPRGYPERHNPFKEAPYVEYLKAREGYPRVMGGYGILFPNFSSAVGLYDVHYINSLAVAQFQDLMSSHLHTERLLPEESSSLWFTGRPEVFVVVGDTNTMAYLPVEDDFLANLPYYSILGVKYLILPRDKDLNKSSYEIFKRSGFKEAPLFNLVYDREVRIYENQFALPRAFMARDVVTVAGYKEAQAGVMKLGFTPGRKVFIEKPIPDGFGAPSSKTSGAGEVDSVSVVEYRSNSVTVEATAASPGLLILSDTYYPGWKAYVDGGVTEIYRVDGFARGVFIKEGKHTVVFKYCPGSFMAGWWLFVVSFIVCAAIFWKKY